jgi:hypothetical protein
VAGVFQEIGSPVSQAVFQEGKTFKARCIRPEHADLSPSMQIYDNGVYCFGCGTHWWPDQFLCELGDRPLVLTPVHNEHKPDRPRHIPMSMAETYNKWLNTHYSSRLEWLYARGLRLEDAINPNVLGHDGAAFVIPVISWNEVQSLRFRRDDLWNDDIETDLPKYWGLPGRNTVQIYKPRIPDWVPVRSDYVHLCEGELDALRLAQEGFPAWSLTNGCRAFKPEHVKEFAGRKVKVVYDQDAEGRRAGQRVARLLSTEPVIWPEVLGKDVTEFLQRWSLQALMNHF